MQVKRVCLSFLLIHFSFHFLGQVPPANAHRIGGTDVFITLSTSRIELISIISRCRHFIPSTRRFPIHASVSIIQPTILFDICQRTEVHPVRLRSPRPVGIVQKSVPHPAGALQRLPTPDGRESHLNQLRSHHEGDHPAQRLDGQTHPDSRQFFGAQPVNRHAEDPQPGRQGPVLVPHWRAHSELDRPGSLLQTSRCDRHGSVR